MAAAPMALPIAGSRNLRIMPLGDSITYGFPDGPYGGYRNLLWQLLTKDGVSFDFVGSLKSGDGAVPEPDNEGHVGWTITQLQQGIDARGWLRRFQPDVILLHIGRNDIDRRQGQQAPAHLANLIDDILARAPTAYVIVAQIIPARGGPGPLDRMYTAAIPGIVTARSPRVSVVDMRHILTRADYADALHPNSSGYDKMARAWEPAIRRVVQRLDTAK